jgi:phage/plasmid primase-like uncharacterized protein
MGSDRPSTCAPCRNPGQAWDADVLEHQFRAALVARNIIPPEPIVADGRLHRCDAAGPRGRRRCRLPAAPGWNPAGGLENWRDGLGWETWRHDSGRVRTRAEWEVHSRVAPRKAARDAEARQRHEKRDVCRTDLGGIAAAPPDHPYLAARAWNARPACLQGRAGRTRAGSGRTCCTACSSSAPAVTSDSSRVAARRVVLLDR